MRGLRWQYGRVIRVAPGQLVLDEGRLLAEAPFGDAVPAASPGKSGDDAYVLTA
jgi:hypothetical protein